MTPALICWPDMAWFRRWARVVLTLRHPALVTRFALKLGHLPNPAAPTRYS
ncbi:hypothetical protein [Mesorhizobium sp. CA4]|uniref:hypothetical protein n=1 Tax=Mesorhizobium sp. CA4 TaxID=588499 RepID=UPI001CD06C84|nr:hypothetical protein [Mesorhizobium sp. CA4]MBZ9821664.1 hypothetical protein [Mesorhizobium sp. CA4]